MAAMPPLVTRVERIWMLGPFRKALDKRSREASLIKALGDCIDGLFANPNAGGLNLETLHGTAGHPVLSARIDRSFRLILTPLSRHEIGLLHFDSHDEAYRWVDRHRAQIPTMLTRVQEIAPRIPIRQSYTPLPVLRADEDAPLAVTSASQWKRMV